VVHVLDATERFFKLGAFTAQCQHFVLDQLVEAAIGFGGLQFLQARNRVPDGAEVGEHPAQPALGDVGHAAARGLFSQHFARGALGTHEQDGLALLAQVREIVHRILEQRNGFFQVDNVDLAACAEDVWIHLRVPVTGLVAKMHASFEHLAHGDLRHDV
jgi:hypothetical protein